MHGSVRDDATLLLKRVAVGLIADSVREQFAACGIHASTLNAVRDDVAQALKALDLFIES